MHSKQLVLALSLILTLGLMMPLAQAKVERMQVKAPQVKVNQRLAKRNLKNIQLKRIQDPEARKAIGEIMRYLRLDAKKLQR